jgi:glycosyltransferase involved in cell wall biosynthesis
MLNIKKNPRLSVVMPVFNAEKYLDQAIQSILKQTYKNFEFIIVNDGSTDGSIDIIKKYQKKDKRIILINNKNTGISAALNEAIKISKGSFIARMDADDVSLPKRFETQIKYIIKNNLDLCGSWIQLFKKSRLLNISKYPEKHKDIFFRLFFMTSFAHPTVIFRKKIFKKLSYKNHLAEDYLLFCEIAASNYKLGNVQKILLNYRVHLDQLSKKKYYNDWNNLKKHHEISLNYADTVDKNIYNLTNKIFMKKIYNQKILDNLLNDLVNLSYKYKINKKNLYEIIQHSYSSLSYRNILFYKTYLKHTQGFKRNLKSEIKMFIKSTPLFKLLKDIRGY